MRRFVLPALTTLGLTASSLALTALPAAAAFTTTFGAIDASQPGHVTGSVTTDAPYAEFALHPNGETWLLDAATVVVPVTEGGAAFDITTWGLNTGQISVRGCSSQSTCEDERVFSESFDVVDVVATAEWPEDTTIGTGQDFGPTMTDPDGGGHLFALWDPEGNSWGPQETPLAHSGATLLPLGYDGAGTVIIQRCYNPWYFESLCRDTGLSRTITVHRNLGNWTDDYWLGELNPTVKPLRPRIKVYDTLPQGTTLTLDWFIEDDTTGNPLTGDGTSGQITGITLDAEGMFQPSILAFGATLNHNHLLRGTLSYADADFGTVSGAIRDVTFRPDTVAPAITSVSRSRSTIYPYKDTYQDTVNVTLRPGTYSHYDKPVMEIRNSGGTVVRRISLSTPDAVVFTGVWNGRTSSGVSVPAGTYTIRGVLTDEAGNVSTLDGGSISVIRKKLATKWFKKTVTPKASFARQIVGACSTLAKPSARGWTGSFGLYSNTRCSRGEAAGFVESHHVLKVPAAIRYGTVKMSVYGGAARAKPGSVGVHVWYGARDSWVSPRQLSPTLGSHSAVTKTAGSLLHDGRWLYWAAVAGFSSRYDVKSFSVTMDYKVLVAE